MLPREAVEINSKQRAQTILPPHAEKHKCCRLPEARGPGVPHHRRALPAGETTPLEGASAGLYSLGIKMNLNMILPASSSGANFEISKRKEGAEERPLAAADNPAWASTQLDSCLRERSPQRTPSTSPVASRAPECPSKILRCEGLCESLPS